MTEPGPAPVALAVELRTDCPSCGHTIPINALEREHRCPSCVRPLPMERGTWESLLRGAVVQGAGMDLNEGRDHRVKVKRQPYRLLITRTRLHCPACRAPLAAAESGELPSVGAVPCDRCGYEVVVRRPPKWIGGKALPGILRLVGEDTAAGEVGDGVAARRFPCPGCGAALPFDGTDRALECPYCHARAWVPDSFLYGSATPVVRRWFLAGPPQEAPLAPAEGVPPLHCVADMAVDPGGNLYVIGLELDFQVDDRFMVWSVDRDFRQRWMRRSILAAPGGTDANARLAVTPDGRLLISRSSAEAVHVLSAADGSDLGELRCVPRNLPEGGRAGLWYDLAMDTDGTLLAIRGDRIQRYGPDGGEVSLWDRTRNARTVLGKGRPGRVASRDVMDIEWNRVAIGWDGLTYFKGPSQVFGYSRDGDLVRQTYLYAPPSYRPTVDADGNLYELETWSNEVLRRWPADGGQPVVIADGERDGYPTDDDHLVSVSPDGGLWIQGSCRLHVIGPDGTQHFARDEAQRDPCLEAFHERDRAREKAAAGEETEVPEVVTVERVVVHHPPEPDGPPEPIERPPPHVPPAGPPAPEEPSSAARGIAGWILGAAGWILALVFGLALLYVHVFGD